MKNGARDYWSFVEKIQDATDYVQELLTENSRLRRRMADLERAKEELAEELEQLRRMSRGKTPASSSNVTPRRIKAWVESVSVPGWSRSTTRTR